MASHNIIVMIGANSPKMKKVPFQYDVAAKPTIADVKAAITAFLESPIPPCTAYYRCPNGNIATVDDSEYYDPNDNVWFAAKEESESGEDPPSTSNAKSGKRKRMAKPTESSDDDEEQQEQPTAATTYQFQHNNTTLVLNHRDNLSSWSMANVETIKIIYNMAKPKDDLLLNNTTNLYDYCNGAKLRAVIVLIKFQRASPCLAVFEQAVSALKRTIVQLAYGAFEDNKYSKHAEQTTNMVYEWLNYPSIIDWGAHGSRSDISHSLRQKAHNERNSIGTSTKKAKHVKNGKKGEFNKEAFEALVTGVNAIESTASIEAMYNTFPHLRHSWISDQWKTAKTYTDVVYGYLEKFPFLMDDITLIINDFDYLMQKKYGKTPDFEAAFVKYKAAFIKLAEQQEIETLEDNDEDLVMLHAVTELVNKYCKIEECTVDCFISTHGAMETVETMLDRKKNKHTANPMILYDTERRIFHIAFIDKSLETSFGTVLEAMDMLLKVYYVFGIQCDLEVAFFFEFMEALETLKAPQKSGITNMKSSLEYIYNEMQSTDSDEQ